MNKQFLIVGALAFIAAGAFAQSNTAYTDQSGAGSNTSNVDQVGSLNFSDVDQVNTMSAADNNVSDFDQNGDYWKLEHSYDSTKNVLGSCWNR